MPEYWAYPHRPLTLNGTGAEATSAGATVTAADMDIVAARAIAGDMATMAAMAIEADTVTAARSLAVRYLD